MQVTEVDSAWRRLKEGLRRSRGAALLFSGGLDSSLLLVAAARVLGDNFFVLTFAGPHMAPGELAAAWRLARQFRVRHLVRPFDPLAVTEFRENSRRRCYACKRSIIEQAWEAAREQGVEVLWDGTNQDDLGEFRPGLQAARELGVVSPLLEAGLGKAAIRQLSRVWHLPVQPPQSCLATRYPYDTTLSREGLARVGEGEAWLRRRGLAQVRLRVTGEGTVRLELAPEEWAAFLAPEIRGPFQAVLLQLGLGRLSLDFPKRA